MLTTSSFYLLLTISIVTKCIDCYVIDNNGGMRTLAKSQTDNNRHAKDFINSNNSNDVNTTMNTAAIDNTSIMPKSNEATDDYSTWKTIVEDNQMSDVETGNEFYFFFYSFLVGFCSYDACVAPIGFCYWFYGCFSDFHHYFTQNGYLFFFFLLVYLMWSILNLSSCQYWS